MRAIRYSFEEAVVSLWRRRRSSSLSVVTITAAILVLGALLTASWNLDGLLKQWAAAAEMSVYLGDDVTPEARATVEQMLRESDLVTEFESARPSRTRHRRAARAGTDSQTGRGPKAHDDARPHAAGRPGRVGRADSPGRSGLAAALDQ